MDQKTMGEAVQDMREWRAAAEERLSMTEERVQAHSDRLSKSEILLNTLLTRAEEARQAAMNTKWWVGGFITVGIALLTILKGLP